MPHPRYRVRTLILATTIAAVVLACLAPWLRAMTDSQWEWLGIRMLAIPVGALVERWWMRRRFRHACVRDPGEQKGTEIRTGHFKAGIGSWGVLLFFVVVAFLVEWFHYRTQLRITSSGIATWWNVAWLSWFVVGTQLTRCLADWMGLGGPIHLTKTWIISPWVCWPLQFGMHYHWRDRATGELTVSHVPMGSLELSIPPENIEEVNRMLSHMLDPPKYQPPVVPPPPAT